MQSIWYKDELQKAILGYRETIAGLEAMKQSFRPCDRNDLWWEESDARILHLNQSIASLENFLRTLS